MSRRGRWTAASPRPPKNGCEFQIPPPGRGCRRPVQNDKGGGVVKDPDGSSELRPSSGASPVWGRGPTAARAADTRAGPIPPPKGLPPGCVRPPQRPSSHFSLSPHPLSPGRTQAGCSAARRLTDCGCPPPGSPGAPPGSAAPNSCGDRRGAPLHSPFRPLLQPDDPCEQAVSPPRRQWQPRPFASAQATPVGGHPQRPSSGGSRAGAMCAGCPAAPGRGRQRTSFHLSV